MKRRSVLLGLGAAAGGSAIAGSGAFTSVSAKRSISIDVAGDDSALLQLGPCRDRNGEERPNGAYVTGASDGPMAIDVSATNDDILGEGVNNQALTTFHDVFQVCNQGTQPVCVDFQLSVPTIPSDANVPARYDFGPGDPAIVFYRGGDESATVGGLDALDPSSSDAFQLDVGDCQCIGFNVRAFGFETESDLFAGTKLKIVADANADCEPKAPPIKPQCGVPANEVLGVKKGSTASGGSIKDKRTDPNNASGLPNAGDYPTDDSYDTSKIFSIGFPSEDVSPGESPGTPVDPRQPGIALAFPGPIVPNDGDEITVYEVTNGDRTSYPPEKADVYLFGRQESPVHLGTATSRGDDGNSGVNTFSIPNNANGPFFGVLLVNDSNRDDFEGRPNADGFDVDAVTACVDPTVGLPWRKE